MAPAGTPAAVVDRLNAESTRSLAKPAIKEKFAAQGLEPGSGKPQDLAATIRTETARWSEVIRKQNIKPD
jgi:tripartite-type tricarboxylate transporter receptor subunit TctC